MASYRNSFLLAICRFTLISYTSSHSQVVWWCDSCYSSKQWKSSHLTMVRIILCSTCSPSFPHHLLCLLPLNSSFPVSREFIFNEAVKGGMFETSDVADFNGLYFWGTTPFQVSMEPLQLLVVTRTKRVNSNCSYLKHINHPSPICITNTPLESPHKPYLIHQHQSNNQPHFLHVVP